ncbi:MAG: DUF971 domain-containing protein [Alphaproteobacteria bacterium]|jgi:DUF971 family protein
MTIGKTFQSQTATGNHGSRHTPVELRIKKDDKVLEVDFDDGAKFRIPAELLRVESPSAEVQGHGPGQKTVIAGRRHVNIIGAEPVGNYAVRLKFDDLHDTGIFSWEFLYDMGTRQDELWSRYLEALEAKGLKRDP